MKVFELSENVLNYVLNENISFKKALKKCFNDNSKYRNLTSEVCALTGCELRHHFLISYISKQYKISKITILWLALANNLFLKKYAREETILYVKSALTDDYSDEINALLEFDDGIDKLYKGEKNGVDYISLRLNNPKWLTLMWNKHFGIKNCFNILKSNVISPKLFVREKDDETHLAMLDDASKFMMCDVSKTYVMLDKSLKHNETLNSKTIFINPLVKKIIDENLNPFIDEFTMYFEEDNTIVDEMISRINKNKYLNLVTSTSSPCFEVQKKVNNANNLINACNVNYFKGDNYFSYKVRISKEQDLIFVNPKSTSFDNIRYQPDYMLHFVRDSIDEIIAHQKQVLDDFSKFVAHDGTLIYFINTLNKKESVGVINEFLNNHPDFSLQCDRQVFPFEKENISCYYAILKRK